MIGFKRKGKKNDTDHSLSANVSACKHSYDKLIELEAKEYEVNSKLVNMKINLNALAEKRDELKESILVDKKKFMSTDEMGDFSITEEIVELQKQYAETQVEYKEEDKAFKELKAELKTIREEQKSEQKRIKSVISDNSNELGEIDIEVAEAVITENEQKSLETVEGDNIVTRYTNYHAKIKDFKISEFEASVKKLEILEPLNQMISQDKFISDRVIELRKNLNDLTDEDFLTNQTLWQELSKLKDKYVELKEKIINKREEYKEVAVQLSDTFAKKQYVFEIIKTIETDHPEKF